MAGRTISPEQAGFGSLDALQESLRSHAKAIRIDEETLARWYRSQLAATVAHREALAAAHTQNLARAQAERWSIDDERWPQVWLIDARLRYADYTVQLLERRGHVLVCPLHGIKGIPVCSNDDCAGCADDHIVCTAIHDEGKACNPWEALSNRGLLTGEGATAWARYCEKCQIEAGIKAEAERLAYNWRESQTLPVTGQGNNP